MNLPGASPLTLGELGEQAVLARILPLLPTPPADQVGPGDDAAVMPWTGDNVVVTVDMMIEGPDFRLEWSTGHNIGWKAMTSNLADCYAMGATPRGIVVAVAAPAEAPVALLDDLARGIREGLDTMAPGCFVVGGDLSTSSVFTVSVTVFGDVEGRAPLLRSGARVGDVVAVAGELGRSAKGLAQLLEQSASGAIRSIDDAQALASREPDVAHHLAPTLPLLNNLPGSLLGATAVMDISDGLLMDATRLAVASQVAIDLDAAVGADESALTGGEDHGFLACFPPEMTLPAGFRRVGSVLAWREGRGRVTVGGEEPRSEVTGWDPYRSNSASSTRVSP